MMRGASSVGSSRRHSGADTCSLHPTYSRANGRNGSAGGAVASSHRPSAEVCCVTFARARVACESRRCVIAEAGVLQSLASRAYKQVSSLQDGVGELVEYSMS